MTRSTPDAKTALIVDDEETVRKFVERVLREAGYKTAVAAVGPEAIAVAATLDQFDILVTDVMMPQMTGDELARRLRQSEPRIKVLYLTGFSDKLFKEKVTLWEDEAFLDKPCSVTGLLQAVSLLLFGHFEVRDADFDILTTTLAAARVHLEVRIFLEQILHRHERASIAERQALLGAAIVAGAPAAGNQRAQLLGRCTASERRAQIQAARRVETEVPHAVRGQPAAIAGAAERLGRGCDDPERRAVFEREPLSRRRRARFIHTGDDAVVARERVEHLAA